MASTPGERERCIGIEREFGETLGILVAMRLCFFVLFLFTMS